MTWHSFSMSLSFSLAAPCLCGPEARDSMTTALWLPLFAESRTCNSSSSIDRSLSFSFSFLFSFDFYLIFLLFFDFHFNFHFNFNFNLILIWFLNLIFIIIFIFQNLLFSLKILIFRRILSVLQKSRVIAVFGPFWDFERSAAWISS